MTTSTSPAAPAANRPWQNTSLPADRRVELLLRAMTLEEKVAQLGSRWVGNDMDDAERPTEEQLNNVAPLQDRARAGDEVVQLYLHDVVAQVARPLKLLTGFARVSLEPGAAMDVSFRVHADRTAYTAPDLRRIVEPGDLEVLVGTSSADLPCRGAVRLTGDEWVVGPDRMMVTPVELTPVEWTPVAGGTT